MPDSRIATVAARSPLAHAGIDALAEGSSGDGLTITDTGTPGLIALRGRPGLGTFAAAVESVTGLGIPDRLRATQADGRCLRWLSPDHFLLSCAPGDVAEFVARIESDADGTVAAIDMTGAFLVLELGGPALASVLAKSAAADLHPSHFDAGKVVSTVFAKATATLRRLDDGRVELIVRRSFADYVWLWLQSAAREHGAIRRA